MGVAGLVKEKSEGKSKKQIKENFL